MPGLSSPCPCPTCAFSTCRRRAPGTAAAAVPTPGAALTPPHPFHPFSATSLYIGLSFSARLAAPHLTPVRPPTASRIPINLQRPTLRPTCVFPAAAQAWRPCAPGSPFILCVAVGSWCRVPTLPFHMVLCPQTTPPLPHPSLSPLFKLLPCFAFPHRPPGPGWPPPPPLPCPLQSSTSTPPVPPHDLSLFTKALEPTQALLFTPSSTPAGTPPHFCCRRRPSHAVCITTFEEPLNTPDGVFEEGAGAHRSPCHQHCHADRKSVV